MGTREVGLCRINWIARYHHRRLRGTEAEGATPLTATKPSEREAASADSRRERRLRSRPNSVSAMLRSQRARASSAVNARDLARSHTASARATSATERQWRNCSATVSKAVSDAPKTQLLLAGEEEPVFGICTGKDLFKCDVPVLTQYLCHLK